MWFIPSRRPHLIERFFSIAPPIEPGAIVYDADMAEAYAALKIPHNWKIHEVKGCKVFRDKANQIFADFPNESYYGVIGDDTVPETQGWDIFLGERAGSRNIALGSQVYIKRAGGGAIGGDLVRALGWLCCPAVNHFYSDDALDLIGAEFKCIKTYEGIRLAHHHFSVGKAPYDDVYKNRTNSDDKKAFENWKRDDWPTLREKIAPLYN